MPRAQIIAETFDLQKRSKLCNIVGCEKLPTKKVMLFEEDRITRDKKTLATVYLCSQHNETRIPAFMTEINREKKVGKLVGKRVSDMGFVTY